MMAGNSLVHVSTNSTVFPIIPSRRNVLGDRLLCVRTPMRPKNQTFSVKAMSANTGHSQEQEQQPASSSEQKGPLSMILDVPRNIWRRTMRPLSDFGFGRRSIWEGGVGLFIVSGTVLLALSLVWLRGFQLRSRFRKYLAVLQFEQACGICTGTPVRIRGVNIGNVIRVNPSLRNVEAVVEVEDDKIIIPRNSLVEVNQSGLIMETMIDITPRDPIPVPSVGPLHPDCAKEGLIICDRQKIKGYQGVSLDALVGIFTRLGREAEEIGLSNAYALAERVLSVVEEARPLLTKIQAMAEDVQPLLADVRDSGLLKEVESLTRSLTLASEDIRRVHSTVMTPENTELVRKSIYTLVFTLKNIESISSDIMGFTGDEATRRNLKVLIKTLSRLL
ncbi:protein TRIGALACTOSYLDIACYLGLYCEROL 2, chloroplastic [Nicotiana tabacum]|uniref:Protein TRIGALACTOSYLDIACYLGLYCEROL 2, chloroplastic n=3 Tax=Nicotiana tabacum TaxID=4097 RepID=A0AC58T012_TOBAC|nr:protein TRIGALACTOSYLDIACYLGLYCEROL 2, chloroplastic [Nicotiana tomentosiformis]XP_009589986.1 protein TRIGALACTOSYLDIACYLGLYCEROL 2, chloroplastic [Nicotiana tomentosiformis]